jgi:GMP synthase-like glutamine amidotransferase
MQIGILQCDSVAPDLQPEVGDYPDMFRGLLTRVDPELDFRVYDLCARQAPESLDECDAWLFTGSKWSVNDDEPWIDEAHDLGRALHEARRPVIGICFGHQLMARALGGRVEKAPAGWGVGVHTMRMLERREWMQPWREEVSLLVSHQDQVTELPPGAERLATHDFCPIDMFQIGDHILTFQGHPEFPKAYSKATMERRRERIGEATYEQGMRSLTGETHEVVAAAWIVRFLERALARQS